MYPDNLSRVIRLVNTIDSSLFLQKSGLIKPSSNGSPFSGNNSKNKVSLADFRYRIFPYRRLSNSTDHVRSKSLCLPIAQRILCLGPIGGHRIISVTY